MAGRAPDPLAPLLHHGLLEGATSPLSPLRVHPLVVARIRGVEVAAPGRQGALLVPVAAPSLDELVLPEGLVESLLPRFAGSVRLLVRGRAGSGRRSLVAALAEAHQRVAGFVDAAPPDVAQDEAPEALARAVREAALRGLLPCVVGLEDLTGAPSGPGRWRGSSACRARW